MCFFTLSQHVRESSSTGESSLTCSDGEHLEEMEENVQKYGAHGSLTDCLAEPEFSGLWEQEYKVRLNKSKIMWATTFKES